MRKLTKVFDRGFFREVTLVRNAQGLADVDGRLKHNICSNENPPTICERYGLRDT
jgi:hypothetical protein